MTEESALETVTSWLQAIEDRDRAAAEAALGRTSLQAVPAMGGLATLMSGLAEGMAVFDGPGLQWGGDRDTTAAGRVAGHQLW